MESKKKLIYDYFDRCILYLECLCTKRLCCINRIIVFIMCIYIYFFLFKTRLKLIFKKVLTLIVSKYHKLHPSNVRSVFFFVSLLLSATSFQPFPLQRPIPFHFHLLPIIKYIRASFFFPLTLVYPPLFVTFTRRFLSNCPSLSPSFLPFSFFTPFLLPRNLPWRSCKRRIELDTPPDTDLLPEIGPLPLAGE